MVKSGLNLFRQRDDRSDVARVNGYAFRFRRNATIPGGAQIFSTRGLCFSFHTSACSRPPPPARESSSASPRL